MRLGPPHSIGAWSILFVKAMLFPFSGKLVKEVELGY